MSLLGYLLLKAWRWEQNGTELKISREASVCKGLRLKARLIYSVSEWMMSMLVHQDSTVSTVFDWWQRLQLGHLWGLACLESELNRDDRSVGEKWWLSTGCLLYFFCAATTQGFQKCDKKSILTYFDCWYIWLIYLWYVVCMWFILLYNRITKDLDLDSPTRSIPVFGRPVRPETHGWGYAQPGILPRMGAVPATRRVGTRPIIHVFGLGAGLRVQKAYQKADTGTSCILVNGGCIYVVYIYMQLYIYVRIIYCYFTATSHIPHCGPALQLS